MGTMAEPRIAVVGCGGMGHNHTRAAVQALGARVVGGCDISPDARERYRRAWGTDAVYATWDELYDKARPRRGVRDDTRLVPRTATIAAADTAAMCSARRPMALSLAECDAMIEPATATGSSWPSTTSSAPAATTA